jgi:adenylate cyclase
MFEEAVEMGEKAIRLHPHTPLYMFGHLTDAYYWVGRYEEALATAKKLFDRCLKVKYRGGLWFGYLGSDRAHIRLGREKEAREDLTNWIKLDPDFNLDEHRNYHHYKDPEHTEQILADLRKAGAPEHAPFPLPDKPSIAVLAFENMSGDPNQEYFCDGISEEIITALSKTPNLFVIDRNSSFSYKGKHVKVRQIGQELGVKYVLEGSVRESGDRIRITAQLVDAKTGNHLWAERYDREQKDIFAIQDEITMKIITALQVKLTKGEQARVMAKGTDNLAAYLLYLQAVEQQQLFNKDSNVRSRQLAEKAIALDSRYAAAYRILGHTYWTDVLLRLTKNPKKSFAMAEGLYQKALALDNSSGLAHGALGWLYILMKQHDKAILECERGLALYPMGL